MLKEQSRAKELEHEEEVEALRNQLNHGKSGTPRRLSLPHQPCVTQMYRAMGPVGGVVNIGPVARLLAVIGFNVVYNPRKIHWTTCFAFTVLVAREL